MVLGAEVKSDHFGRFVHLAVLHGVVRVLGAEDPVELDSGLSIARLLLRRVVVGVCGRPPSVFGLRLAGQRYKSRAVHEVRELTPTT